MSQASTSAMEPGACDGKHGRAEFYLFAPEKQRVTVIGTFNDWNPDADPLEAGEPGHWRLTKELPEGEHAYQFVVDGTTICDPYACAVGDPRQEDGPPVAVRTIGASAYQWRHDQWQRPDFSDLSIYELHIGDFTEEGTLEAATAKLDYLRDLGVNALQLMPVTESAITEGWGYQPTYYFAVKRPYGSADDLKRFIDQAHARNIAVIFDLVIAHSAPNHPFAALYEYEKSPWYGEGIGGSNSFGLPTFDHRKPATQQFARLVQQYWLKEFHGDGFRYDYAINIGIDGESGLPRLARDARACRPDALLIGEYLPEDPKTVGIAELNANWHLRSSFALKALALQRDHRDYHWNDFDKLVHAFDPGAEGYEAASHMVNYIESHDEPRLIHELRAADFPPDAARRRLALAATILLSSPGVPMIYQGQEWGEDTFLSTNERNPIRWPLLETTGGGGLHEHYRKLLNLRQTHPALRADGFKITATNADQKWVVLHRWDDQGGEAVLAANFSNETRKIAVPFPRPGVWADAISGRSVERGEGDTVEIELQAVEASLFIPRL